MPNAVPCIFPHGTRSVILFAGYRYVTTQDGTSRSESLGLRRRRLEVLRSAQSHSLLHTIPSVSRAWVVGLKLAPKPARAYRRAQGAEHTFDLGGWASRHFTEVPTRRPASTELEPHEPDRAPDLIGAYGHRTSNTNHVPFASFRIEWTPGASAPECGVARVEDDCHVSRPASIWDLRSAGRSYNRRERCIPPLSSLRRRVRRHAP